MGGGCSDHFECTRRPDRGQAAAGVSRTATGREKAGPILARTHGVKDLFVFIARFEDRAAVERAFEAISNERSIASCMVEPEELRIRLLAPKNAGSALVEQIYERGGLRWCKRYALGKRAEAR
jgi:hypothetical protein